MLEQASGLGEVGARPTLAEFLRRRRRSLGLTQKDLARSLHVGSYSTIVDFEAGRRLPPSHLVDAYERALSMPAGALRRIRADELDQRAGGPDLSDRCLQSYRRLHPAERRTLWLLAVSPVPSMPLAAVGALLRIGEPEASRKMASMVDAHVVERSADVRYAISPHLRPVVVSLPGQGRDERAGVAALYRHYLELARAAATALHPERRRDRPGPPAHAFLDGRKARAWLEAERDALLSLLASAVRHGDLDSAWLLLDTLRGCLPGFDGG